MANWLVHPVTPLGVPVDIYAVGFEEMVDLTASNMAQVRGA